MSFSDDISLAGDGPCSFGADGPCSLRALYDSHAAVLHGNAFFSVQYPYTPSFRSVTHGFDHFLPHPLPHVFANTIRVITNDSGT